MYKRVLTFGIILLAGILAGYGCQKKSKDKKDFARVGGKTISQESYKAFEEMRRLYPSSVYSLVYPGRRSYASQCVETQALFRKAKSAVGRKVKNSNDWKWKKKFYSAQMYFFDIIDKNMGFQDEEIEKYYNDHKEEYKRVIKVSVPKDTTKAESTASDSSKQAVMKDSVIYRPLNAVRNEITKKFFLKKYPPTEEFYKDNSDSTDSGWVADTAKIREQWVLRKRKRLHDFYMREMYKDRTGKTYSDSMSNIYGEGLIITPKDMDVILGWLPEASRKEYDTREKQFFLVEWLLKWEFFSDAAEKTGFNKRTKVKLARDWAYKYEVVLAYLNEKLAGDIGKNITVDTTLCVYEYWDRTGRPGEYPDSAALADVVETNRKEKVNIILEEKIYAARQKARVTFLQTDYMDDRILDPDSLAAKADSLYGAGASRDAERLYRQLLDNFPFHAKGLSARVELAKILTENEKYTDAIKSYRQYLLFSDDVEKRCNIFFMIGFVYGEYLNKPELAEASYKWILKNTPDCELADDAEFMCLHLDEPMIGVDELQAEARRQGRKVEETEPVSDDKKEDDSKS